MEYKTTCRLCRNTIEIKVCEEDDEAAKAVGLHLDNWMAKDGKSTVLCESCYIYKETGRRPTNTPPMKDFLFE